MELVKYVIEYNGRVIINNEFVAEVEIGNPLVLEWPKGNALVVDPKPYRVIKISDSVFVMQGKKEEKEKEVLKDKGNAVEVEKLETVLGHVRITKRKGEEVVESYVAIRERREVGVVELPFAFLQCVQYGDYQNARGMLAFEISDGQMKEYFGEFEVFVNNYLGEDNLVSILPKGSEEAKTYNFVVDGGSIVNIE